MKYKLTADDEDVIIITAAVVAAEAAAHTARADFESAPGYSSSAAFAE